MIQERVRCHGSVGGKEPEVDIDVTRGHVGGRVGFVFLLRENTAIVNDLEDGVGRSISVECAITAR